MQLVEAVARERGLDVTLEKLEDMQAIIDYGAPKWPRSPRGSASVLGSVPRAVAAAILLGWTACALARGPWRADEGNTQGWRLMSPEERIEHQAKVRGFKTYEACLAYQVEHHREIEARARAQGLVLRPGREDICDHLAPRDAAH